MSELFEKMKKREIERAKRDIKSRKAKIKELEKLIQFNEMDLKSIPKSIERKKTEIEIHQGEIYLIKSVIENIKKLKALEEEK